MGGHAVAFRVEVVADLHRVARLLLVVVLVHRRFEQERVAAFRAANLFDTVLDGWHEDVVTPGAHRIPHLSVRVDARLLRNA